VCTFRSDSNEKYSSLNDKASLKASFQNVKHISSDFRRTNVVSIRSRALRLRDASLILAILHVLFTCRVRFSWQNADGTSGSEETCVGERGREKERERRVNLETACCARGVLVYEIPPCCFQAGANHRRPRAIFGGNGRE